MRQPRASTIQRLSREQRIALSEILILEALKRAKLAKLSYADLRHHVATAARRVRSKEPRFYFYLGSGETLHGWLRNQAWFNRVDVDEPNVRPELTYPSRWLREATQYKLTEIGKKFEERVRSHVPVQLLRDIATTTRTSAKRRS